MGMVQDTGSRMLALLRGAFAVAPAGVIVTDNEAKAVYWNDTFLEMWALSPQDMEHSGPVERRAAALTKDPEAFTSEVARVRREPGVVLDWLVELVDGRTLQMHSFPLDLGDGPPARVWCSRDVTELVQARELLDETVRVVEAQFAGAPYGIVAVGLDGRFIRANPRFFAITGLDPSWAELLVTERRAALEALAKDAEAAEAFNSRWRAEPGLRYSHVFETVDGRLVRVTTEPWTDADGRPVGQLFFYDDVTAEEKARQAVAAQERLLRQLVDSIEAGIVVVDRSRRPTLANPAALRILGLTAEELAELSLDADRWEAQRGDGTPMPLEEFPAEVALRTGSAVHGVEMGIRGPEGRLTWLVVSAAPLEWEADGTVKQVVATFYDVTDVREAQAARARARHLESLAVLAAGVAHRLNNHLTAIIGNAWLVGSGGGLSDEQSESLREIQAVAKASAALVQDLRAYAAKGGGFAMPVDANAVVTAALTRFGAAERSRLSVVLAAGLPAVLVDPGELEQAIANLVENALEAGPGPVEVRTTAIEARDLRLRRPVRWEPEKPPEGHYVAVMVEDGGRGMDEEERARVFEPFYSTRSEGRGLGLAATLGIARKASGYVGLETAPGRGTVAMMLLPPHR